MRKTLIGAVASAALVVSTLASAATAATRVDGDHFAASGLRLASQSCLDPALSPEQDPRTRFIRNGSVPFGTRALGWTPTADDFGVGPMAHVGTPSTLSRLAIRLYSPSELTSGQAVATYAAPGDDGLWRGRAFLAAEAESGWHTVDATTVAYQWRHYNQAGVADQDAANQPLQSFVTAQGGDGAGAWVGFAFGCDGDTFYVDGLRVSSDDGAESYDFEGYRTRTSLQTGGKARRSLTIPYGKRVDVAARLRTRVGNQGVGGGLLIQSRELSTRKWKKFDRRRVGNNGNTSFRVSPNRSTAYRAAYAGTTAFERGVSSALTIRVRKKVTAGLADSSVVKGRGFTLRGRVLPSRAGKIVLQRYLHGEWRNVKRGRTDGRGRFGIGTVTRTVGYSYWRVVGLAGGGNAIGFSDASRLKTTAPPSGGGGGGNPDPDPGEPPPPPPPPPPGPQ